MMEYQLWSGWITERDSVVLRKNKQYTSVIVLWSCMYLQRHSVSMHLAPKQLYNIWTATTSYPVKQFIVSQSKSWHVPLYSSAATLNFDPSLNGKGKRGDWEKPKVLSRKNAFRSTIPKKSISRKQSWAETESAQLTLQCSGLCKGIQTLNKITYH